MGNGPAIKAGEVVNVEVGAATSNQSYTSSNAQALRRSGGNKQSVTHQQQRRQVRYGGR